MKKKPAPKRVVKKHVPVKETVKESAPEAPAKSYKTQSNRATIIVKIIAIFEYIAAGFGIVIGLIFLFGGPFLVSLLSLTDIPQGLGPIIGAAIIVLAILMIIFSVCVIFIAKALWEHKKWARIVFLVFSSIGAITALMSLPSGIAGLLIHGTIIYFLGFDKEVKALCE
jgi:hypothetical protein